MTAPTYPQAPQMPPSYYPPQVQQPPQYPPQQGYQPPPPAFPQQFMPGVPAQPAVPAQPLAQGSLDDYFSQPSSGSGKGLSFQVGQTHIGIVARPVTAGDVQQQTNKQGQPQFFKDGRPKFVMIVPLVVQPSAEFPDGRAAWYVKGQARDELVRAMAEAGAPAGAPEVNAVIQVTCTGERPIPGYSPAKQFAVAYQRPDGSAPAQPAAAPPQQPPAQQFTPPPAPVPGIAQQPPQAAPQTSAPAPEPPAQAPAAPAAPAGLTAEQQALLQQLANRG